KTSDGTKSGLKSFFSGILNTVKEEKEELEQEIANSFGETKTENAPAPAEDLLDAALKQAPAQPAAKAVAGVQASAPQQAVPSAEVTFS
ncbi:MAG TPA: hypothetical protein DCP52_01280, partial [Elusimicrobia bacterium]|nr:hypothetical protein [Elusimicrobiota bacterium]